MKDRQVAQSGQRKEPFIIDISLTGCATELSDLAASKLLLPGFAGRWRDNLIGSAMW